jgi:hypothetical protein
MKRVIKYLSVGLILSWFFMTLFVDILAVPTVFKNVSSVEEAGKVGMTIFTAFNRIEFILAFSLLLMSFYFFKINKKSIYLIIPLFLFLWSISYNLYFTPQIIYFTKMIHSHHSSDPQMAFFQQQHTFYHQLYKKLDSIKLLMLFIFLIISLKKNELEAE